MAGFFGPDGIGDANSTESDCPGCTRLRAERDEAHKRIAELEAERDAAQQRIAKLEDILNDRF